MFIVAHHMFTIIIKFNDILYFGIDEHGKKVCVCVVYPSIYIRTVPSHWH